MLNLDRATHKLIPDHPLGPRIHKNPTWQQTSETTATNSSLLKLARLTHLPRGFSQTSAARKHEYYAPSCMCVMPGGHV